MERHGTVGICSGPNGCGETWTGFRIEHCTVCHQTFTGTQSGDMHRVGPHWPIGQRRCLTPAEMETKGMRRNARGRWTTGRVDLRFAEYERPDPRSGAGPF